MSIERLIAFLLGPIVAAAAAWLAGAAAKYGLHLDQTEVAALATAGAISAGAGIWKWLQGRQNPEILKLEQEAKTIAGQLSPGLRAELEAFVRQEVVKGQDAVVKAISAPTTTSAQAQPPAPGVSS